ncbi:hypothetical protein CLV24_1414 [Pontibacter ummariensis]|uniref:Uncharacterized protein n=1 Tax=Pontibacter ummariensis TaxID=1610492 RepID=A0A239LFD3_9BACT|nr:hypothetical protein [Pontibacter ummariensis]PRY03372.1 hypothetical protein CLV24_1414 [Pontibacter ummariensis]SNT29356.1 hypothetical protein SAMN06296052_14122 [Pontibacter ummariensis]
MQQDTLHTFHIPVMGLAFSIDSPLKVARYGISSVLSLSDDTLLEQTRAHYCQENGRAYAPIHKGEDDYRARRVTAYLDLLDELVTEQVEELKQEDFTPDSQLTRYFTLLPDTSPLKALYNQMLETESADEKLRLQEELRKAVVPGSIDVNIMTKLDKTNYDKNGEALPQEYCDALAALRGFAQSTVGGSVVFSAGMNLRLFGYLEQFPDLLPDHDGHFKKEVIIKVSDYRSALVQGKILAKKGLWVSEFRIESGLNCGGHAFATDGYLLGPILEEFKQNREALREELYSLFCSALASKGIHVPAIIPAMRITVQGGVGTPQEHNFLLEHYGMDSVGWGTPFLLVPEATTVDEETLLQLSQAKQEDLYLSPISPLGVPFNALRNTSSELLKMQRIEKGKPGSPCIKKHLVSSTEFTEEPLCTASRKYQRRKLEQLQSLQLAPEVYLKEEAKILVKECLCDGLANSAMQLFKIGKKAASKAVTICPGPNLAFFSGIFKLQEMVDHIYGRFNALNGTYRPHMFVNELRLYVDYWKNKKAEQLDELTDKQRKHLQNFWQNLQQGIQYYKELLPTLFADELERQVIMLDELLEAEDQLLLARLESKVEA